MSDAVPSIAELLKVEGLNTIRYAALPADLGFSRGFDKNIERDGCMDRQSFRDLLKDIGRLKHEEFFVFFHTWMVHAPYSDCYFADHELFDLDIRAEVREFRALAPEAATPSFRNYLDGKGLLTRDNCIDLYDGGIRLVDRYMGRLFQELKQLDLYGNAMIVVTSDHGEHFGEHWKNRFYDYHGLDLYEEFIHVPLIVKYPTAGGEMRVAAVRERVSQIDIVPTILDTYGISVPEAVQGRSLVRGIPREEQPIITEALADGEREMKMLLKGDVKYIVTMGSPEGYERANWGAIVDRRMFDLTADPTERDNLCVTEEGAQQCAEFERELIDAIYASKGLAGAAREVTIDEQNLEQLRQLGYIE